MTKQKIETLLNSIRCDLFHLQEKMKLPRGEYFSPAHDAYSIIETHTKNAVGFIDQFTPSKERPKKYKHVIIELINLDRQKLLNEQVASHYEEN